MSTRRPLLLLAAAGLSALLGTVASSGVDADDSAKPAADRAAKAPAPATTLGISSCAASSCHGSPVGEAGPDWHSSYTSWFTRDPHAKAYNDLFNERSRRMIAGLEKGAAATGKPDDVDRQLRGQAYLAALETHGCLACHANARETPSEELAVGGLDCHNCHGQDQGWVEQHYLVGWQQKPAAVRRSLGMQPTKDLADRAAVCTQCHLGAPAGDGLPVRDMNHDLIAAGHPRLNFEFAAYLTNLPPHWNQAKDAARLAKLHDNVQAETWLVGQETCATAAIRLLVDRAERAARQDARGVWPEFSEYDCYGCHHQLASPSTRPPSARLPGRWQWGTWHFGLVQDADPLVSDIASGMRRIAAPKEIAGLVRLAMPERIEIPSRRAAGSRSLNELIERLSAGEIDKWHWDQYAQWYLGLRALQAALREANARGQANAPLDDQPLDASLDELEAMLKFPADADSPWSFDPTDPELQRLVERIRGHIPALAQAATNASPAR